MKDAGELFDEFSESYEQTLTKALGPSGEGREYFANGRAQWLRRCLDELNEHPGAVLDFGCGDGATSPVLREVLQANSVLGTDVSPKSIAQARKNFAGAHLSYVALKEFVPTGRLDLAYCNGVFHHIPPAERMQNLSLVYSALRDNGLFSFWENNPWNLATRYVMWRVPFDRDAILLTPRESASLLKNIGFEIIRVDYRFIFPRSLKALRKLEDVLYSWPLGTQYHVLARKPRGA
jgi:SAM-dependent methyltransferase